MGKRKNKKSTTGYDYGRHSYYEVEQIFKENGCELLSKEYHNQEEKLRFKCHCGNISDIKLKHFIQSKQCKKCGYKRIGNRRRLPYEYVKKFYEDQGCKLISSEYNDVWEDLEFECLCGNVDKKSFAAFKMTPLCSSCISRKKSEVQKFSHDYVKNYFEDNKCKLLSIKYENSWTPLDYICEHGHKSKTCFSEFIRGHRCRLCSYEKKRGPGNWNWIKDREKLQENNLFKVKIRNMLKCCLLITGMKKNNKTEIMLGYTSQDLKSHIQKHPNWPILQDCLWHIDHIFPISAFVEYNIRDPKIINCLDNLRPIACHDNLVKNCKYSKDEFEKWLKNKNIPYDPTRHC